MDIEEKVSDLLDGNLSGGDEDTLFSNLATDKELRSEFKQSLAIEMGMARESAQLVPSRDLSNSIFAELGIGAAVGAAATQGVSWFSGKLGFAISSLVGAGISALIFWGVGSNSDTPIDQQSQQIVQKEFSPIVIEIPEDDIRPKYQEQVYQAPTRYTQQAPLIAYDDQNSRSQNSISDQPLIKQIIYPVQNTYIPYSANDIDRTIKVNNSSVDYLPKSESPGMNNYGYFPNLKGWSVRINKFSDVSYFNSSGVTVSGSDQSEFKNFSIAIMKKINSRLRFGIEVRRESVFQEFSGSETFMNHDYQNENINTTYFQLPAFTNFTLQAQYDFYNFMGTDFYTGFDIGANTGTSMLITRVPLGLRVPLSDFYSLDLGANLNAFGYNYQGNSNFNAKASFYGGIVLEF